MTTTSYTQINRHCLNNQDSMHELGQSSPAPSICQSDPEIPRSGIQDLQCLKTSLGPWLLESRHIRLIARRMLREASFCQVA